ncbi:hypothetical protein EU244_025135 [Rhodococcus qingshengii]|uniref:hypothetical protein n=1 Tax=Rhodococcus qingshengii TaxID=334542 RepID=UPI0010A5F745|nr:hypothetical protein [Rhodococcus qingshengii]THJ70707.1 hypothetical protein EU244_15320 [Rhodococcus qingshengii]
MIARLELPHSRPPLSMNDRGMSKGAAMAKAQTVKGIRETACTLAKSNGLPKGLDYVVCELHYRPRDNRRRDTDNLTATAKPLYDGLIDYGLVPDDIPRHMAKREPVIHPAVKGQPPALWLEIEWSTK